MLALNIRDELLQALFLLVNEVDFLYKVLNRLQVGVILHLHNFLHLFEIELVIFQFVNALLQGCDLRACFLQNFIVQPLVLVKSFDNDSVGLPRHDVFLDKEEQELRVVIVLDGPQLLLVFAFVCVIKSRI